MLIRSIAAFALIVTMTTPCMSQTPFAEPANYSTGASAGVYLRIPLDRRGSRPVRPQMGLRVAALQDRRDPVSGRGAVADRDVVDFRFSGMTRPTLLIAGAPVTGPTARQLNAIGTGEAIAIGGGVVLVLLVVALASGGAGFGDTCPVIDGDRSHCID
ncbi:MAG TPA: hypothetical protein VFO69_09800 [Allosphingosinicella sp.]|nr:hypothetical protein [Allosphingosinicella sp.]